MTANEEHELTAFEDHDASEQQSTAHPTPESSSASASVSPVAKNANGKPYRTTRRKMPMPPPPRATPSSSSGYPGVSWNKRMGAWLSFYYDADTRRSRTFHPKYYDFDVEKAKQAAIEFMKSIEKHPRCSLRKGRREAKAAAQLNAKNEEKQQFAEGAGRTRKRSANNHLMGADYNARNAKSPINRQNTQTSISDMYDLEALKRNFHMNSNLVDPCYIANTGSMEPEYSAPGGLLENNYLSGSFESQQDFDKGYQSPMNWQSPHNFFGNPEYYVDTQNYSLPFLEGDMAYSPQASNVFPESDVVFAPNNTEVSQHLPTPERMTQEQQDRHSQQMFVGNYETSPTNEETDIRMLMQSIALSSAENVDGFRMNSYNYGESNANYQNTPQRYSNRMNTPLGSPYFSPYVQTIYNHFPEDSDLNRTFGFQTMLLANEPQSNQQAQSVMHSQS
ncbi:uncharacterized protein BXIN_2578 [Babesia sp. Xinjiang]|uniref:uncharacterized protein n=1 Tax=Babesia sp. Xinjiang TaxID=462227 RepID=UPI000A255135|nr:uncharacterized protein BXIN_2578 [Babesia sp. Xinjiang]ORM41419.1 hypothetical protein BXIN_2578 [Babesia sp. Xinjiang]